MTALALAGRLRSLEKSVKKFQTPKETLGDLDANVAATLISAASDIALVVDADGVIRDLAFSNDDLSKEGFGDWLGRPWADTVTVESRPKVEELLRDAASKAVPRWRQVNHPSAKGIDLPVRYSAVQVGREGRIVAVGRDLRAMATMQQRLIDVQQSMEREYARMRHAETRYRLLFQIASEPVLIVDAGNERIVEANPAAGKLLGRNVKRVVGRSFVELFDGQSARAIETLLNAARTAGRGEDARARLAKSTFECVVSASLFRLENASHFLIRLSSTVDNNAVAPRTSSKLLKVVENLPDGFVVTDLDLNILTTNSAFLDLAQLATEEQARGTSLERWLGRSSIELNALAGNLRQHGAVRNFATLLRGEHGSTEQIEISAVSVLNSEQPCFGFTIRNTGRRSSDAPRAARELPRSVDQLTELVGRVSLKELVRETTDVIERLCIEAALELTGDNRASAAEMLGLSRQSFYVKLRRYGLGELDLHPEAEDGPP